MSEKGVLIASNEDYHCFVRSWYREYIIFNTLPITIIDFGMTTAQLKWCEGKMDIIPCHENSHIHPIEDISKERLASWDKLYCHGLKIEDFWTNRKAFHQKARSLKLTPYNETLWLDLDCQVRGNIEELFHYAAKPPHFSLAENKKTKFRILWRLGIVPEGSPAYNSGVIVYKKNCPIMEELAEVSLQHDDLFYGDQDILNSLIYEKNIQFDPLPEKFNCPPKRHHDIENPVIVHWVGKYKKGLL